MKALRNSEAWEGEGTALLRILTSNREAVNLGEHGPQQLAIPQRSRSTQALPRATDGGAARNLLFSASSKSPTEKQIPHSVGKYKSRHSRSVYSSGTPGQPLAHKFHMWT
jgi:hypothetical protein